MHPRPILRVVVYLFVIIMFMGVRPANSQKVGAQFRVNTHTAGDQITPAVALNAAGQFVVVWESDGQDGSGGGIYGQRYDGAGVKVGAEFQVNDYTDNNQQVPSVAIRPDGSFVVTWHSRGQDGDGNGIVARIFDADGNKTGEEFQVNTYTFSNESRPTVDVDPGGNIVIAWQSTQQDGSVEAAMARRYDPNGVALTGEIMLNRYTYSFQGVPRVECDTSGAFVATYCSHLFDGDGYAAVAQRVSAIGSLVGDELQANTYTTLDQDFPDIAVNPDGSFVVIWYSTLQDGDGYGVYGQRYNSSGARAGGEFMVNNTTQYHQQWSRVASDAGGGFTVVWQTYTRSFRNDIYGRRYQSSGTPHGNEFRVNQRSDEDQERPDVSSDPDGNLVVVWQSRFLDGSGYGIYGQRFSAMTVPVTFSALTAAVSGNKVKLRWVLESDGSLNDITIHRRIQGQEIPSIISVPRDASGYDDVLLTPGKYTYHVVVTESNGDQFRSHDVTAEIFTGVVRLFQNHPNPFNPTTQITYELDENKHVELDVYDVTGRLVVNLVRGPKTTGVHTVLWDGHEHNGRPAATGLYFCRLKTGTTVLTKRMLLLK